MDIAHALATKCSMTHHVYAGVLETVAPITTMSEAMALDFQLAIKMTARLDFVEGMSAVLIDKTNDAGWQPAWLEDVSSAMVDDVFAAAGLPALR